MIRILIGVVVCACLIAVLHFTGQLICRYLYCGDYPRSVVTALLFGTAWIVIALFWFAHIVGDSIIDRWRR